MRPILILLCILFTFPCHAQEKSLSPAAAGFLQLAEDFPATEKRKILNLTAVCRMAGGDREGGRRVFRELLKAEADPDSGKPTVWQMNTLEELMSWREHAEALRLACQFTGSEAQCLAEWIQAEACRLAENHAEAVSHLRRAVEFYSQIPRDDKKLRDPLYQRVSMAANQLKEPEIVLAMRDAESEKYYNFTMKAALRRLSVNADNVEARLAYLETFSRDGVKLAGLTPILRFYVENDDTSAALAAVHRILPPEPEGRIDMPIILDDGRDMAFMRLAVMLTEAGRLRDTERALAEVKRGSRRYDATRKVANILTGKTDGPYCPYERVFAGHWGDIRVPERRVSASAVRPEFPPDEIREFCLWLRDNPPEAYTHDEKQWPTPPEKWLAAVALFMAQCDQPELARQTANQSLTMIEEIPARSELWKRYGLVIAVFAQLADENAVNATLAAMEAHDAQLAEKQAALEEKKAKRREADKQRLENMSAEERSDYFSRARLRDQQLRDVEYVLPKPADVVTGLCTMELDRQAEAFIARQPEESRSDLRMRMRCMQAERLLRAGEKDTARELIRECLAMPKPGDYTLDIQLDLLLHSAGLFDERIARMKTQPDAPFIARCAAQAGRVAEAEEILLAAAKAIPHPPANDTEMERLLDTFLSIHWPGER